MYKAWLTDCDGQQIVEEFESMNTMTAFADNHGLEIWKFEEVIGGKITASAQLTQQQAQFLKTNMILRSQKRGSGQ